MARREIKNGRSSRLEMRLSPEERDALQRAADQDERTVTDWARRLLLKAARKQRSAKSV